MNICYLLFQLQKHRSHFMIANLSATSAANFIVGEEWPEIEFLRIIYVLVFLLYNKAAVA